MHKTDNLNSDIRATRKLAIKAAIILVVWLLYVVLAGLWHPAHICLGVSIASLTLLMTEEEWTMKSASALVLNLVALTLCFWLLIQY